MTIAQIRPFGQRYAFVVVGVIFLSLLIAAGLRSSLSVMMLPLEDAFGWRRDVISLAAAIGIFIYGLAGPFAAALMERIGVRRTLIAALLLMSSSTALSLLMTDPWHLDRHLGRAVRHRLGRGRDRARRDDRQSLVQDQSRRW